MNTIVGLTICDCGEEWGTTAKEALAFETEECPLCGAEVYHSAELYGVAIDYLESKCKISPVRIGSWKISYNPKPIPDRRFDFDGENLNFDGENGLCFSAANIEEVIHDIEIFIKEDV